MKKIDNVIKLRYNDTVGVALKNISEGDEVLGVKSLNDILKGHKIALEDIKSGEDVIKYGVAIGHATCDIKKGEHVHIHNIKTNLKGILEYTYEPDLSPVKNTRSRTFLGYKRTNGTVGIRNEIWIINTVGCVNKISEKIIAIANERFKGLTDGIFTFTHPFGCSQLGVDQLNTQKILASMVNHPNAAGILILGLGCENNNIKEFKKHLNDIDQNRVKFLIAQEVPDEIEAALSIIEELVKYSQTFKRDPVDLSNLVIGLKCGGSDGLSGITANPLVGNVSDALISYGATTILTEVPEMFGAEKFLMARCVNREVFDRTTALINDFKSYFIRYNQEIYENPSPGNKDGGISTLEDKSIGCIQKGGASNICGVLSYGDKVSNRGLNLLSAPGNDTVAITALMAAGAHIVLFTTGRGTPVGAPVPTVKVSSNTDLFLKKSNWIDFNAGPLVEDTDIELMTESFIDYLIQLAEGKVHTKNEQNNYREISILKDGVTL